MRFLLTCSAYLSDRLAWTCLDSSRECTESVRFGYTDYRMRSGAGGLQIWPQQAALGL